MNMPGGDDMLPEALNFTNLSEAGQPTLTFKIDFKKNKIVGKISGIEAVKQAVFLMLSTERDYSVTYKDYGIKINDLLGQDIYFIASELKRRIKEALKEDDRIVEVYNFEFNELDEGLEITFDVASIFGSFPSKGVYNI